MKVNGYKIKPGANLVGADLSNACPQSIDLSNANLECADLSRADIRGVNLRGANLFHANLKVASLPGADLSYADLQGANLTETDLIYATLNGANLTGTNLDEAICHGMQLLNRQRLPFGKHVTEPYRDGKVLGSADLNGAIMPDGTIFNPVIRTDNWLKHYRDRAQERKSE